LLTQVLSRATNGHDAGEAVELVTNTLGLSGYPLASDLEQAMLDVWALSEAVNGIPMAA
jgi:glutamate dehydrogenase